MQSQRACQHHLSMTDHFQSSYSSLAWCKIFTLRLADLGFLFFSFIRWNFQSPRWRWQSIAGPPGCHRTCELWEYCLARFPFWVAHRWSRTAVDVLLSDCQYRMGTAVYGQCGVWNTGDSQGGCGLSWTWTLSLVSVWLTGSSLGIQVIVEAVVACPEPKHCQLFPSG